MAYADKFPRSTYLHGFSGILSTVHRRFFENNKSNHRIAEEEQELFWAEKCTEAFRRLKELLMTTLILKVPDMEEDLLV
jgi:hypothetical protein